MIFCLSNGLVYLVHRLHTNRNLNFGGGGIVTNVKNSDGSLGISFLGSHAVFYLPYGTSYDVLNVSPRVHI